MDIVNEELQIASISALQAQSTLLNAMKRMVDLLKASFHPYWKTLDTDALDEKFDRLLLLCTRAVESRSPPADSETPLAPIVPPPPKREKEDERRLPSIPKSLPRAAAYGMPLWLDVEKMENVVESMSSLMQDIFFGTLLAMEKEETSAHAFGGDDAAFFLVRDGFMRGFNDQVKVWSVVDQTMNREGYLMTNPDSIYRKRDDETEKEFDDRVLGIEELKEAHPNLKDKKILGIHLTPEALGESYVWTAPDLASRFPSPPLSDKILLWQQRSGPSGHPVLDASKGTDEIADSGGERFSRTIYDSLCIPSTSWMQPMTTIEEGTRPVTASSIAISFGVPLSLMMDLGAAKAQWVSYSELSQVPALTDSLLTFNKDENLPRSHNGSIQFHVRHLALLNSLHDDDSMVDDVEAIDKRSRHREVARSLAEARLLTGYGREPESKETPLKGVLKRVATHLAPSRGKLDEYLTAQGVKDVTASEWLTNLLAIITGANADDYFISPPIPPSDSKLLRDVLTTLLLIDVYNLLKKLVLTANVNQKSGASSDAWKKSWSVLGDTYLRSSNEVDRNLPPWIVTIDDTIRRVISSGAYGPVPWWPLEEVTYPIVTSETITIDMAAIFSRSTVRQHILSVHLKRRRDEMLNATGQIARSIRQVKKMTWDAVLYAKGFFSRSEPEDNNDIMENMDDATAWKAMERLFADGLEVDTVVALGDLRFGDALYSSLLSILNIPHDVTIAHAFSQRVGAIRGIGGKQLRDLLLLASKYNAPSVMGPLNIGSGSLGALLSVAFFIFRNPGIEKERKLLRQLLEGPAFLTTAITSLAPIVASHRSKLPTDHIWALGDAVGESGPLMKLIMEMARTLPGEVLHNGILVRAALRDILSRHNNLK